MGAASPAFAAPAVYSPPMTSTRSQASAAQRPDHAGQPERILIIGAGHAAAQLCMGLAAAGRSHGVTLIGDEPELPYQRPPLSKGFLKSAEESLQWHRPPAWYADAGIDVRPGDGAVAIDRIQRKVTLRSGTTLDYDWLVIATGSRARMLPHLTASLSNVLVLRNAADAVRLRERLASTSHLTVLGGGFIGLEVAAAARARGLSVRVLESAPRLLMRSASAELAAHVLQTHRDQGIEILTAVKVGGFDVQGDRLASITVDDTVEPVEQLLLGIGSVAEHTLATQCGLATEAGIEVDAQMRTSDPRILAIGDCTRFKLAGHEERMRLESVQNARDQASVAVATLTGQPAEYRPLPSFWSEQGSMRLQMAGTMPSPCTATVRRPGPTPTGFTLFHLAGSALACVESVNAPVDHMAARRLLETGARPAAEKLGDPSVPLKSLL